MMQRKKIVMLCVFNTFFILQIVAQEKKTEIARIVFWNVENFFDPSNDSIKNDDDFTPNGINRWTYSRFEKKKNNIYKTLVALGGENMPVMVGLCEIENDWVLQQLCLNTPLRRFSYNLLHYESPDMRGIDVALIYRPEKFHILYSKPIAIDNPNDVTFKTRDILLVSGILFDKDTLFTLIAHFPSKRGGASSDKKRNYVASKLRNVVDTIVNRHPLSTVIVMGDFNDTPFDNCITKSLGVLPDTANWKTNTLINTMCRIPKNTGTYKYKGDWSCIDQIMVSKNVILNPDHPISVVGATAHIFAPDFLLIPDTKFLGKKLFRTYAGMKYQGGFSDHLPIYIDIQKK